MTSYDTVEDFMKNIKQDKKLYSKFFKYKVKGSIIPDFNFKKTSTENILFVFSF